MLRILVRTGGWFVPEGATNANPSGSAAMRPPEVTTTSAVPGFGRAPMTAVRLVAPWKTTFVATTPPTATAASLVNSVPVIVTSVPPVVLPTVGEIDEMASDGDGGAVGLEHAL